MRLVHSLRQASLFGLVLAAIALPIACGDNEITSPTRDFSAPRPVISDGSSVGGTKGFYFLPPMVSRATFSGTSDGTLSPHVTVCEFNASTSKCGNVIADFSTQGGTGAQVVRYDATAEQYIVNWDTKTCITGACTLDPAKSYRLRVFVGRAELGFADVKPVSSGSELKNASTGEQVALLNGRTLPVKFRIEQGAVKVIAEGAAVKVDAQGATVAAADGSASLAIPAGAVNGTADISVAPATDAPTGPINGLAPVVDLGPNGTQFSAPVQLTLPFDPAKLPPGVPASALALYTSDGNGWQLVPGSSVDETSSTVTTPITHFSYYSLQIVPNTISGITQPTTIDVGQTTTVAVRVQYISTQTGSYCYPVYTYYSNFWTSYAVITGYNCTYWTSYYSYPATNTAVSWISSYPQFASVPSSPTFTDGTGFAVSPSILGISPGTTPIVANAAGWTTSSLSITVVPGTIVRTTADDGPSSLRSILASAPAGSTITFADPLTDPATGGTCSPTVAPGCTIRLASPLTIAKNISVQGPVNASLLTVDGQHTTSTTGVQVFIINSGTVALNKITIARGYAPSQGGGVFVQSGTVTLDQCRIINNRASTVNGGLGQGGGLYNLGGNVTLLATTVSQDTADAGGALYNYNNGTLNVGTGSTVSGSVATNIGGGVLNFGTLRITGATVSGNSAVNQGGGIYNFANAQLVLTQSTLQQNTSPLGGGLYNYSNGIVTINGSSITQNTSSNRGAGIYNNGSLTIDAASSLQLNRASNQGGGLFNDAGTATINGAAIAGNRATGAAGGLAQGGGVYNLQGTVTLAGATVNRDTADAGGGLYNYNFGALNVNSATNVLNNVATNVGGGAINFGTLRVTSSTVRGNNATNQGGGLYNFANAQLFLTQSNILENTSPLGAGVYNYSNGTLTVVGTAITQNIAATNGGGIYNIGSLSTDATSSVSNNRAANQGGGIFNGGTATITGSTLDGDRATAAGGALGQGGAVYNSGGTFTLNGASLNRDTADAGGALYNYNSANMNVNAGTSVLTSYATNLGGGIINFGNLHVNSSTIRGNSAVNQGGGIYNFALGLVWLTQSSVVENTSPLGGGIYNYFNGTVTVAASAIDQNIAATNGGGVYNNGTVTMDATSSLSSNRAPNQGGGIFNDAGTTTFTGTLIAGNRATGAGGALGQGGGVYNAQGGVTLAGARVSRDTADAGGALYNYNFGTYTVTSGTTVLDSYASNVGGGVLNFGIFRVTGSSIRGNSSVNQGGGLYNFANAQLVLTDVEVTGNNGGNGGGLYNYSNGIVTLVGGTSICGNSATTPPANISNIGSVSGTNYSALGSGATCLVP